MTTNQIAYAKLKEDTRHNLVTEGETNRSNVAREVETNRHNTVTENETARHNLADELEKNRSNVETEKLNQRKFLLDTAKAIPAGYKDLAQGNKANADALKTGFDVFGKVSRLIPTQIPIIF